jgi:hypothetical protein
MFALSIGTTEIKSLKNSNGSRASIVLAGHSSSTLWAVEGVIRHSSRRRHWGRLGRWWPLRTAAMAEAADQDTATTRRAEAGSAAPAR